MGHGERLRRERSEAEHGAERSALRRVPPSAHALLALQASAGNRAVTAQVQRFLEHETWTRESGLPTFPNGKPSDPGWKENEQPPKDVYMVEDDTGWWSCRPKGKGWTKAKDPYATEPVAETKAEPKFRPAKPIIADLGADTSMKLGGNAVPEALVNEVFKHLDGQGLAAMRVMDPYFREKGSTALRNYLKPRLSEKLTAMSSLDDQPLIEQYHDAITERPASSLVVASDQVNQGTVSTLVDGFPNAIKVLRGAHDGQGADGTVGNVEYKTAAGPTADESSKMHNKAVVGMAEVEDLETKETVEKGDFLVSGSPNLTQGGMDKNTESAVTVRFPGIAQMYKEYLELIEKGQGTHDKFGKWIEGYNAANLTGIRAALAPFVDIGKTLNAELQGADQVTVRMYLVGSVKVGDPLDTLCNLRKGGASVSVTVDQSAAEGTPYVRMAMQKLQDAGVSVSSEGSKKRGGIMHDKLIFAHYPKTATSDERWTVMIGSSGLTENVIGNKNYENLLIIDDKALFDTLQGHHAKGATKRTAGIPAIPPGSDLGKVLAAIRSEVTGPDVRAKQSVIKKKLRGKDQNSVFDDALVMLGMKKYRQSDGSNLIGY
jgi:HKD family nuclease